MSSCVCVYSIDMKQVMSGCTVGKTDAWVTWRQGILHRCFTLANYTRICLCSERMFTKGTSSWTSCFTCYSSACRQ